MVVAELTITPVVGEDLRPFVDAAVEQIRMSGLKYEVDAMGTTIEGEVDRIFDVARKAHNAVREMGADRILTELRIDDRKPGVTISQEVEGYRASV